MKRILYVITKSDFGGAQRYVYELATSVATLSDREEKQKNDENEFEAHVALGGSGSLKAKLENAGIPIHQMIDAQRDIDINKEYRLLKRLISIIKTVRPDVVHLNSPKIGGLGAVASRLCGVKNIIYTNHGWPFKEDRPVWQLWLIKLLSWVTIFFSTKTIVLSEREKEMVKDWPFISNKIELIPNGLKAFEPLKKADALAYLVGQSNADQILNNKITVVGTISELHKNKGLTYAIEGFAKYINEQKAKTIFIIIGEGEERTRLETEIKKHNLESHVFLVGRIDNARNYLTAFDYFLLSSIKEGLPYAILEAGAIGLPVIATHVGGIPEIITNLKEGIIISPRNPMEISQALTYLDAHPDDAQHFANALHEKIQTIFSFKEMLRKTKELYFD